MTIETLIKAQPALQKLILQDLPLKTAYKVMKLAESINPHLKFYTTEIAKCGHDPEAIEELLNFETEEFNNFEPIQIPLNSDIRLTAADIKHLLPFISFIEGE